MTKHSRFKIAAMAVIAVGLPVLIATSTDAAQPSNPGSGGGSQAGSVKPPLNQPTIHGSKKTTVRGSTVKSHLVTKPIRMRRKVTPVPVVRVPVKNPGTKTPIQPVLRRIPPSLGWTCFRSGGGEYTCTDPKTGKNYLCTNDPGSGEKVCEVGDDTIDGSTNP